MLQVGAREIEEEDLIKVEIQWLLTVTQNTNVM
jgi:hypothetical protein